MLFRLCVVLGATAAAPVLRRCTAKAAAGVGLAVIAIGNCALLLAHVTWWVLPLAVGVAGVGIGLSSVAATTLGTDVPAPLQGIAAGALNTAAQLGTALGVAAVVLVATVTARTGVPVTGASAGWLLTAGIAASAALVLLAGSRVRTADT